MKKETRRKHNAKTTAAALALLLLLTGCGQGAQTPAAADSGETAAQTSAAAPESTAATEETTQADAAEGTRTVTDMTGREVEIPAEVTRVVALSAADCEILYAVGAGDLLVGRGEYCDYPAEVMELPAVSSGAETNVEEIIALEPEVVFMSTMAQATEPIEALQAAGIAVVASEAPDFAGVYDSVRLIGDVTGHAEEAEAVVKTMEDTFAALAAEPVSDGTKTIYFEVSPLEYGLWAAGGGSFMDEIATMLGLTNIFHDEPAWAEISEEQVIERNPDYIVTISMYFGEGPTPEEEIMSRPGWENVTAVQNGSILNLQNNELSRPVPRLTEGAQMLHEFVIEQQEALDDAA